MKTKKVLLLGAVMLITSLFVAPISKASVSNDFHSRTGVAFEGTYEYPDTSDVPQPGEVEESVTDPANPPKDGGSSNHTTVQNPPKKILGFLPQTGEQTYILLPILGILIFTVAITVWIMLYKKRKKEDEENEKE